MNYYKRPLLFILGLLLLQQAVWAISLDEQEDVFFKTQTGSYLHAMYPQLKPEAAVKAAIDHTVSIHKRYIEQQSAQSSVVLFDFEKKDEEINKLFQQVEGLLQKEIECKDTHAIFYHGFSSGMYAYESTLKELMGIATLRDMKSAHPLHYKTSSQDKIANVQEFLDRNRYLRAHYKNVANLKKMAKEDPANYGIYKNLRPFDLRRNLGVGKAPDSSDYAREHLKSVNLSLFGNSENIGECSFLFYLTSGNIGNFNNFLMTKLLKEVGIISDEATEPEIDQKLQVYKDFFAEKMAAAGGAMIQIMMKNEIVDKYGFAAWAKGIPHYVDRKTGRFATRGGNNKAIPFLGNDSRHFVRPSLLDMINLYKQDPFRFMGKYSSDGKQRKINLDRFQARLFINPKTFANVKYVNINSTTRNAVAAGVEQDFKDKLRAQLMADLSKAISNQKLKDDFADRFEFGKFVGFFYGKTSLSEVIDITLKSAKTVFKEAFDIIKNAMKSIAEKSEEIMSRFNLMERLYSVIENVKEIGKNAVRKLIQGIRRFI